MMERTATITTIAKGIPSITIAKNPAAKGAPNIRIISSKIPFHFLISIMIMMIQNTIEIKNASIG